MLKLPWDLRYAFRAVWRRRAYSTTVIVLLISLTLSNTVAFNIIHSVLLAPLPYPDADRIIVLSEVIQREFDETRLGLNLLLYSEVSERSMTIESAALVLRPFQIGAEFSAGERENVTAVRVTPSFFRVLGMGLSAGRWPEPGSDEAVISGRLGRRLRTLPTTLRVGNRSVELVGAASEGVSFPSGVDLWLPYGRIAPDKHRSAPMALARLREGVTVEQARAEVQALGEDQDRRIEAVSLFHYLVGKVAAALWLSLACVGIIVLAVSANVANLSLVEASRRRIEFAIRAGLGCSPARLLTGHLLENSILVLTATGFGLWLAALLSDLLIGLIPFEVPRLDAAAESSGQAAAYALVCNAVPFFSMSLAGVRYFRLVDLRPSLSPGSELLPLHLPRFLTLRRSLCGVQVCLGAILIFLAVGASASTWKLLSVPLGFDPQAAAVEVKLPAVKYPSLPLQSDAWEALLEAVDSSLPAGMLAGISDSPLLVKGNENSVRSRQSHGVVGFRIVSEDALAALGVDLLDGRLFTRSDRVGDRVTVVNQTLAADLFPESRRVVGERLHGADTDFRIIGVVADIKGRGPTQEALPEMYILWEHFAPAVEGLGLGFARRSQFLVAGGRGDSAEALAHAAARLRAVEPEIELGEATILGKSIREATRVPRFWKWFTTLVAVSATGLAAIGVYGVSAYAVRTRRREIAVRLAVGASPQQVFSWLLCRESPPILLGALAGALAGFGVWRLAGIQMFGITSQSLGLIAAAAFGLALTTISVIWPTARRASRSNPVDALRSVGV